MTTPAPSIIAAFDGRTAAPFWLIEIDLQTLTPSGPTVTTATYRYAWPRAVSTPTVHYESRAKVISSLRRSATALGDVFERNRVSITLDNGDRGLGDLVEYGAGSFARWEGSAVRFYLGEESVPAADWFLFYTGKILRWTFAGGKLSIEVTDAFNDFPDLIRDFRVRGQELALDPGLLGTPNQLERFSDRFCQYIIGARSGVAASAELDALNDVGTWPFCGFKRNHVVSGKDFVHLGILRGCKASVVYRNYRDPSDGLAIDPDKPQPGFVEVDAPNVDETGTVSLFGLPVRSARFDAPAGANPLDARPKGAGDFFSFDTIADNTQTWANGDPVGAGGKIYIYDVIRGIIEDLAGLDFDVVVGSTSVEWLAFKTTCENLNYESSGIVAERVSPASLIAQVLDEFDVSVSLTVDNRLHFFVADLQYSPEVIGNPDAEYSDELNVVRGSLVFAFKESSILNRITYEWNFHTAGGAFISDDSNANQPGEVFSPSSLALYGEESASWRYLWISDDAVALGVSQAKIDKRKFGESTIQWSVPMIGFARKIFDVVSIRHYELPLDTPESLATGVRTVSIQRIEFDPMSLEFDIFARDISAGLTSRAVIADNTASPPVFDAAGLIKLKGFGSADVANGSPVIALNGLTPDQGAALAPGDVVAFVDASIADANKKTLLITSVLQVGPVWNVAVSFRGSAYTAWANAAGLPFEVWRGWTSATTGQKLGWGFFADGAGQFSNGDFSGKTFG